MTWLAGIRLLRTVSRLGDQGHDRQVLGCCITSSIQILKEFPCLTGSPHLSDPSLAQCLAPVVAPATTATTQSPSVTRVPVADRALVATLAPTETTPLPSVTPVSSSSSQIDGNNSSDSPIIFSGSDLSSSIILSMYVLAALVLSSLEIQCKRHTFEVADGQSSSDRRLAEIAMLIIICGLWVLLRARRRKKQKRTYPVLFVNDSPQETDEKHRRNASATDPRHQRNPSTVTLEAANTTHEHSNIAPPSYSA
ncbi:hypothetical protein C8J56DRAFT_1038883 [Mycena floridula]|nr:hypothetical protein C8J56DRAFT_1038883 [Mycena floridula]